MHIKALQKCLNPIHFELVGLMRDMDCSETTSKQSACGWVFKIQFGTNRGCNSPFPGTIDLNKCYIKVGDKLWWEGEKGACRNANK